MSCSAGIVIMKMSSNHPVPFFIYSWRYCSVVIGILHMCLMFFIIYLPSDYVGSSTVVIAVSLLDDSMHPCPPSSCTASVSVSVLYIFILMCLGGFILISLLLMFMDFLLFGVMDLVLVS